MSSAALITSTPVTSPTNNTTYFRNSPRFMPGPMVARPGGAGQARYKTSFGHLVSLNEDRLWHGKAEGPRGAPIQHQFEDRGLLDRQVRRLGAAQHLVEQLAGAPPGVGRTGGQGDQAALVDGLPVEPQVGQAV